MPITTLFGLAGCALVCIALVASALRLDMRAPRVRYLVVAAAAVVLFVPIGDLSIAAYVRGVTGDLSAATLALAAGALSYQLTGRTSFERREVNALLWLIAVAALFLYPFALGWTPFDPYALGYGSTGFITALLVLSLVAWHAGWKLPVIVILVGALAYIGGAYESRNLWDYLIYPLAAIYALARLLAGLVSRGAKLPA
jgi:hypothetical protein